VGASALPVFLVALGAGVWDSQFGLILKKSSEFGWSAAGERLLPGFFVGATQTPRVFRVGKTGLALGDFKFSVSVLYLAYRAPTLRNLRCIEELMWEQNTETG
jgi:hypothetical protein